MRRCAILKGRHTLRSLNPSTRKGFAAGKVQELASWRPILEKDSHEDGTQRSRKALQDSNIKEKHSHGSVHVVDSRNTSVKNSQVKNFPPTSPTDNAIPRTELEAQPLSIFPLSPLMDPEYQQAKKRYRVTKQPPTEPRTQLQQELAKNPFALALASPIRECRLNGIALPKYFLLDFKVLLHPTTEAPYFVPTSLTRKYARLDVASRNSSEPIAGLTAYTLANKQSLAMMQDPRSGYFKGRGGTAQRVHHTLIPRLYLGIKPIMKTLSSSRWRPDMEGFVLELMRRRCVERLAHLANLKRGYLIGCTDWEDATNKPSVGAFLWTGGEEKHPSDPPADFATLDLGMEGGLKGGERKRKRKVPVYNLRALLGLEKLAGLRDQLPNGIFTRDVVAVKHKKMTVELQMHLWKMQGYIAEFDKLFETKKALSMGRNTPDQEDEEDDEEEDDDDDFFDMEDYEDADEGRFA